MQVTQTHSEGLKRGFTVTVPAGDLEARRAARLAELGRTINLPGFRPGKVPVSLVKQRYGAAIDGEVLEQAVNDTTSKVIEDQKLRPATQPKVELVSGAEGKGDLEFKIDFEILPDIATPDLSNLELTRLTAKPSAEVVDKALNELAKRQRSFESIEEDRPAAQGDVLNVDFVGKLDGTPFDGGTAQDVNVEIGGEGFIPGFAEQLEGMKPGEEKVINVTFPADYNAKELAGKGATFDIKANALKKPVDPALDDELAKKIGFEGIEQVRDLVSKQAENEYAQLSRLRIKRELLDALAEKTDFPAPESMIDAEFAQIWQRVEQDRANGETDEEDEGKDEETLRADYRKIAERRVKLGLLLAEIGRAKEITVSREELMQAVRQEAMRYPGQEQAVFEFFGKNPQAADGLRGPILENKVVDYLIELAKVTDKEVTPEELAEIPPADL
ncbi:peptidyl-prolyl cis-trans isomerase trigger factor [Neoasaia chiangmaiensis NBRC 101099]|uniref:Trigger factor n=1 Tax=Neoasaia chiangmaiensis TaxID=320497 RepID=A0A1U9KMS2_9PROT|nr:trigger factor [Neoasaia chiangmaiensis]AQS87075.1 trigger factor [Neoasaia chiangmaiensis]GBR37985.1 peptidyl-prolyl cis-trans isomerase trigger factor [Neoasaia chiangmaiensis NBRC 101099]GEN15218.1 trigger factor [Neoasaia chiangmaiensis]